MKVLLLPLLLLLAWQDGRTAVHARSPTTHGHWKLLHEKNFAQKVLVQKYQSRRSDLRLTIAQLDTPIVEVYMCVPTEVWTHDGAPHVLEHLLFQRSRDYPYKNFLRQASPRFNCGYLNAYTDTDHTCYYFKTAGSDGALRFMQLYLNQMLYASLTDEDILTEAHHVNGKGEDGGVVYSEMKGYNSQHWFQMRLSMRDSLYPGNSSYQTNQGGSIEGLRTLTPERIREYHRRYYNTENIVIAINGKVAPEDVFKALEPVERRAYERGVVSSPLVERPFTTEYPDLEEDLDKEIPLSAAKDEAGRVLIARRLPWKLWDNFYDTFALQNFVSTYLGHTSVSPLQEEFVNGPDAVATGASFSVSTLSQPYVQVGFSNVEVDRMDELEPALDELVRRQVEEDEFDLERMRDTIVSLKEKSIASLETSASFSISGAIKDAIYSHSSANWEEIFDDDFDSLLAKPKEYWTGLIKTAFSGPRILLKGLPSEEHRKKLAEDEKERLKKQKEDLGEEGMKEAGDRLAAAIASAVDPPEDVLESFPLADTESIKFLPLESYNYTSEQQPKDFALRDIPYRVHVDEIDSQYVRFSVHLNVTDFPAEDWFYIELLAYVWQKSPLVVDGETVPLADVIKRKDKVALEFSTRLVSNNFIEFRCKCSLDNYEKAVDFTKDMLFRVDVDQEKVKNHIDKLVKRFHDWKNSETGMMDAMMTDMLYSDEYKGKHSGYLRKYHQAKDLQAAMEEEGGTEAVMDRLRETHRRMVHPRFTFLYLAGRMSDLTSEYGDRADGVWKDFYKGEKDCQERNARALNAHYYHSAVRANTIPVYPNPSDPNNCPRYQQVTKEELEAPVSFKKPFNFLSKNAKVKRAITGNHGVEACFVKHRVPFLVDDYLTSPDVPAFELAGEIFNLALRNVIRLHGTAYGGFLSGTASSGYLQFMLYRGQNTRKAYQLFKEVLANHTDPSRSPWSDSLIETTKGKLIYSRVNAEATPEGLAGVSRSSVVNGLPDSYYNREYADRINKVTKADLDRVAARYLTAFDDAEAATVSISCYPTEVEPVASALEDELGVKFERIDDIENSIFAKNGAN